MCLMFILAINGISQANIDGRVKLHILQSSLKAAFHTYKYKRIS